MDAASGGFASAPLVTLPPWVKPRADALERLAAAGVRPLALLGQLPRSPQRGAPASCAINEWRVPFGGSHEVPELCEPPPRAGDLGAVAGFPSPPHGHLSCVAPRPTDRTPPRFVLLFLPVVPAFVLRLAVGRGGSFPLHGSTGRGEYRERDPDGFGNMFDPIGIKVPVADGCHIRLRMDCQRPLGPIVGRRVAAYPPSVIVVLRLA